MAFDQLLKILESVKSRYPGFGKRMEEAEALGKWEIAVGPAIAKHSRAIGVEGGVLLVEVDHPIWRSELHHRKRQILDMLNGITDQKNDQVVPITEIHFVDPRPPFKNRY